MVYVSLDGEAGPLALGLPELVRLCLVAPWWESAPGRTAGGLRALAEEYREDGPGSAGGVTGRPGCSVSIRPGSRPRRRSSPGSRSCPGGPVAAACPVVGDGGESFLPLFAAAPGRW